MGLKTRNQREKLLLPLVVVQIEFRRNKVYVFAGDGAELPIGTGAVVLVWADLAARVPTASGGQKAGALALHQLLHSVIGVPVARRLDQPPDSVATQSGD